MRQVQSKLPGVSAQSALSLQLSVPMEHSSISIVHNQNCHYGKNTDIATKYVVMTSKYAVTVCSKYLQSVCTYIDFTMLYSLVQLTPLPSYPTLQVQLKLPLVLLQKPLSGSQVFIPAISHSSISKK